MWVKQVLQLMKHINRYTTESQEVHLSPLFSLLSPLPSPSSLLPSAPHPCPLSYVIFHRHPTSRSPRRCSGEQRINNCPNYYGIPLLFSSFLFFSSSPLFFMNFSRGSAGRVMCKKEGSNYNKELSVFSGRGRSISTARQRGID